MYPAFLAGTLFYCNQPALAPSDEGNVYYTEYHPPLRCTEVTK